MRTALRRLAVSLGLAAALFAGFVNAPPARAATAATECFRAYGDCVNTAANLPTFWQRSLAGLDCAITLVRCVRDAVNW